MSYMLTEIHEQPDVIAKLIAEEHTSAAKLAEDIEKKGVKFVVVVARGTSDDAALYGKYLMEINNGLPVAMADCSVFTLYDASLKLDNALVIGVAQSGEATDVAEYLERAGKMGALTAAITNEPGSKITKIANHTLLCHAGTEKGVAATKTYTSTLAVFHLLSAMLSKDDAKVDKLLKCADAMRSAIGIEDEIAKLAERYRYMQAGYVISRGYNYCTALEASLKLAETCYVGMLGYSAADFLHGPIAAVQENEACFLPAPPGKAYDVMTDITTRL